MVTNATAYLVTLEGTVKVKRQIQEILKDSLLKMMAVNLYGLTKMHYRMHAQHEGSLLAMIL